MFFKHEKQNWLQQNKWDKGRENANTVLYWFGKVRAYVQYSSNSLEIFLSLCKFLYNFWTTQGQPIPCVQESLQLKRPQSLNQSLWMRRKKEELSLEENDITIEVHGENQEFLLREQLIMKFSWNISLIHFVSKVTYL